MKARIVGEVISIDTTEILIRCESNKKLVKVYLLDVSDFDPWLPDIRKLSGMEVEIKGVAQFTDGEVVVDPEEIKIWRLGKNHTKTSPSETGNIHKRIKKKEGSERR